MNEQDQIKAIAELDGFELLGFKEEVHPEITYLWMYRDGVYEIVSNYLHSYDAIIPVIQKQSKEIRAKSLVAFYFNDISTPSQLCEALLRATGKWKE